MPRADTLPWNVDIFLRLGLDAECSHDFCATCFRELTFCPSTELLGPYPEMAIIPHCARCGSPLSDHDWGAPVGDNWRKCLELMRDAGLPVIGKLIADREHHNPYLRMNHVRSWGQIVWVKEELERHGFLFNGRVWMRTNKDANTSLQIREVALKTNFQPQMYPVWFLYGRTSPMK